MLATFFLILLVGVALTLIFLILIQKGKGGGLAGAFGGAGGQSAFGAKAGDTFTKVTVGVAIFWIVLCVASLLLLSAGQGVQIEIEGGASSMSGDSGGGAEATDTGGDAPSGVGDSGAAIPAEGGDDS